MIVCIKTIAAVPLTVRSSQFQITITDKNSSIVETCHETKKVCFVDKKNVETQTKKIIQE